VSDRSGRNLPFEAGRVLIVDDLEANVLLLRRLLERAGLSDIHTLTDSREAVRGCLDLDPDLLLLDLHMPHLDGTDVLRGLREALPPDLFLPVLVLTADISTEARELALDLGAKDFLTKPFDAVEVVQRVRNLLEMRSLYQGVQAHNTALQAELEEQEEERHRHEVELEDLRRRVGGAFVDGALEMAFQPIVDLRTESPIGVEALARFSCEPVRSPDQWFADAAVAGRGVELEIKAVATAIAALPDLAGDLLLSVNASPATAVSRELPELLARAPGPRIVLELTEHTVVDDYDALKPALEAVREQGVRIAVDDAGAGYAGLQHILSIRPDIIKLDIEITRGIDADPVRRALASCLVTFSQDTGAVIIAEGIETDAELQTLRQLGVPWGQGFHLGRPGRLTDQSLGRPDPVSDG
jgi:EAL domain-containing protein (putative c-di-GMP-specific phosphodiesterase class I)